MLLSEIRHTTTTLYSLSPGQQSKIYFKETWVSDGRVDRFVSEHPLFENIDQARSFVGRNEVRELMANLLERRATAAADLSRKDIEAAQMFRQCDQPLNTPTSLPFESNYGRELRHTGDDPNGKAGFYVALDSDDGSSSFSITARGHNQVIKYDGAYLALETSKGAWKHCIASDWLSGPVPPAPKEFLTQVQS